MSPSSDLQGSVVVTGAGSGIGRAVTLACAETGASVAALDIDAHAAESAGAEALDRGAPAALGLACDVREEPSVAAAVAAAAAALGDLRGLVTCAGVDRGGLVHELDAERWLDVLATNLTGTFLACKHVLVRMLEHGQPSSIVCVSSPWAQVSAPGGASAYCASKGGVSALVRSLALDYAPNAIRVNAIVPGATDTPLMWANVAPAKIPEARGRIERQLALGRLASPAEIAAGVVWLLSDQSAYATGSHLVIDGGLLARASISD